MRYEDKDLSSLIILNQGSEGNLHLCEDDWKNIALIEFHLLDLERVLEKIIEWLILKYRRKIFNKED